MTLTANCWLLKAVKKMASKADVGVSLGWSILGRHNFEESFASHCSFIVFFVVSLSASHAFVPFSSAAVCFKSIVLKRFGPSHFLETSRHTEYWMFLSVVDKSTEHNSIFYSPFLIISLVFFLFFFISGCFELTEELSSITTKIINSIQGKQFSTKTQNGLFIQKRYI